MRTPAGQRGCSITGRFFAALLAILLATGCSPERTAQHSADRVAADVYRAFYLWPGVEPLPEMTGADAVYLLWGEVRHGGADGATVLRRGAPRGRAKELWLVVRADRIDWSEATYRQLIDAAQMWNVAGNLTGVQVDFDSSTGQLAGYAEFLAGLRGKLPKEFKLSATGLMDWPANASEADLAALAGSLDEIVVQTYQGRDTVPGYARYLAALDRLPLPYRVAIVEGGEWKAQPRLTRDPRFRGYVVFLLSGTRR